MKVTKTLTIAGSDSGGGAGIQADLKTFTSLGTYGMSVVTAITAQNTTGVFGIQNISVDMIEKQLDAVIPDIGVHAAKTGMLSVSAIIELVADKLTHYRIRKYVVDPVMVSKSGHTLLQPDAVQTLVRRLLPIAHVATPNLPEAELITGLKIGDVEGMEAAGRAIHEMGARHVVVKGGHLSGGATDVYFDGKSFHHLKAVRIRTKNTHGTGCTFSAAITAYLAMNYPAIDAVRAAKRYVTAAIRHALKIGKGHGPLNHYHGIAFRN